MFSSFSRVDNIDDQAVYELLPGTRIKIETQIVCRYRGEYEIGIKEIEFSDFLNVFSIKYQIPGSVKVFVEPKLVEMEELRSFAEVKTYMNGESFRNRTDPDILVRDFRDGDSMKEIHWGATAKERKLKVRTRKSDEQQKIIIILDTERKEPDNHFYIPAESKLLEILLAISFYLFRNGIRQEMFYSERSIRSCSPDIMTDFDRYRKTISHIEFNKKYRKEAIFEAAMDIPEIADSRVMVLLLLDITDDILSKCEKLKENGIYLIIYIISADKSTAKKFSPDERQTLSVISPDDDLKEVL